MIKIKTTAGVYVHINRSHIVAIVTWQNPGDSTEIHMITGLIYTVYESAEDILRQSDEPCV